MQSCLNRYNSWMYKTRNPKKYEEFLESDKTCSQWENDSIDCEDE